LGVDFWLIQALNGLARASSLFLVASGLALSFGVTRTVNFAHGSLYMMGAYLAWSFGGWLSPLGIPWLSFWGGILLAAGCVALIGLLMETTVLRRIYQAPELFQLLATFGLVLVFEDLVLLIWGAEDKVGSRAPGLRQAVTLLGRAFPSYELLMIGLGPLVLGSLWLILHRTRWGVWVRAATQDRQMVAALGVDQAMVFTSVFGLGAFLAGLGGALQQPRTAITHTMDMAIITEVFVVVVIGGLGSLLGSYLAAILIGELHAFGIVIFPQITLVLTFLVMAVVLVVRPWGLLGRPTEPVRSGADSTGIPLVEGGRGFGWLGILALGLLSLLPFGADRFVVYVTTEVLIIALFGASLHFIWGTGGLVSFGHAAYFGLGSYGAALAVRYLSAPMAVGLLIAPVAGGLGALIFGWFCVRLTGIYLAMLTLAFAQLCYAVAFQWYGFTGGDNGLLGIWPADWARDPGIFYTLVLYICAAGIALLRRTVHTPFGYGLRASRDSGLRAESIGIPVRRQQWLGFTVAGLFAGLAGGLYAFFKGSVFPDDVLSLSLSIDGLLVVLLGGVKTLSGPLVGSLTYKSLQVWLSIVTDYWRLVVGSFMVLLVVAFPQGIVGFGRQKWMLRTEESEPEQVVGIPKG
jgi:branched-chain amino acid transport system permease protein